MVIAGASSGLTIDTSNAVQILLLVGGLSLVPALLFCVTGFSRILIVLGFIRTAMGTQTQPPNQVLIGIALFLTLFVMKGTVTDIVHTAWDPLEHKQITVTTAVQRAEQPLRQFMFRQTGSGELSLFVNMAHIPAPKTEGAVPTYVLI